VRSLTLPGAAAGVHWYILKFDAGALTGRVMLAALGQAVFSLSLGGTFMVVYGSYVGAGEGLGRNAVWTATGDLGAGLLAGLAIIPAVFALGLEPSSGPGLLFATLPEVFGRIPLGGLFEMLFFLALFGAAYLSDVAAFEVLVAGLTDNTRLTRRTAVRVIAVIVFLIALPPMISMRVFVPWDLTFGSGMQTLGALLSVLTLGWAIRRSDALRELAGDEASAPPVWLYYWLRYVIPVAIFLVGVWWVLTDLLGVVAPD
jgi:NSS family neurotransmitter:Na+ symporter